METQTENRDRTRLGTVLVLMSAALFSTGGAVLKLVPWQALTINGARNLIAALVLAAYMVLTRHRVRANPTVLLGAFSFAGVTSLFVLANKMTSAANAIILQYTCPVWIILIMALFFHERPSRRDLVTVTLVFAGILCFFFDSLTGGSPAGDLIAVLSGIFYAGVFLMNTFEDGDSLSSILIGQAVSALLFLPGIRNETDFSPLVLGAVLFLGVFQVGAAYICLAQGTKHISAVRASIIGSIEPILNPALVALVWHETLPPLSLIGAVIVIGAVAVSQVWKEKEKEEKSRPSG